MNGKSKLALAVLVVLVGVSCTSSVLKQVSSRTRSVDANRQACSLLNEEGLLRPLDARLQCAEHELRTGEVAMRHGYRDMALYHYQKALLYVPDMSAAHNAIGEVFQVRQDYAMACVAFERALRLDPQDGRAERNRATCLREMGELASVQEILETCDGADDLECHCARGNSALSFYDAELPDGLTSGVLERACPQMKTPVVLACESAMQRGDCDVAARTCHEALTAWPENKVARRGWRSAQACLLAQLRSDRQGSAMVSSY